MDCNTPIDLSRCLWAAPTAGEVQTADVVLTVEGWEADVILFSLQPAADVSTLYNVILRAGAPVTLKVYFTALHSQG